MKFRIERTAFLRVLQRIQGIVEKRNTMPILANVLINASGGGVELLATDLEVFIKDTSEASVEKEGSITLNARKLFEIVKELPEETVNITADDSGKATITSGKVRFNIMGLSAKDFPSFPEVDEKKLRPVDHEILKEMIDKTSFAVSTDETRYNINGFLLESGESIIRMVATDGHRLALIEKDAKGFETEKTSAILPRKGVLELRKLLEEKDGEVLFGLTEKNAITKRDDTVINIRLFEGEFPDYKKVIPTDNDKEMLADRKGFLASLKRVSLLSPDRIRGVKFSLSKNRLVLSSSSAEIGDATEDLDVEYNGEDMEIAFNARYFTDALEVMDEDRVSLKLKDPLSPGLLTPVDGGGYTYIVMPMRL